jgi:SAM-dependent methyltransferase
MNSKLGDDKALAPQKITFSFGKNWRQYVQSHLTPERERVARESMVEFLGRSNLQGQTFLDIGCGSGLFSLGAFRLGADQITSVDVDPYSVESTNRLRNTAGSPSRWAVLHGSILDKQFIAQVQPADIVYAWGSLHHTGSMWDAIRNTSMLVKPGGHLYLSIYNRVEGRGSSEYWLKVKKMYNRRSEPTKRLMELAFTLRYHVIPDLIRLRNPMAFERKYSARGMNFWIDVRDWLGGFPYEYARADEIFTFCTRELGLTLVNLRTVNTTGVNEFLFRKL